MKMVKFEPVTRNSTPINPQPFAQRALPDNRDGGLHVVAKKETHRTKRAQRDRERKFRAATTFAHDMDWPLNLTTTFSWRALMTHAKTVVRDGHCLGRGDGDRSLYVRRELARLCRREDVPWAAIWGRDVGPVLGAHDHLFQFWPAHKIAKLVAEIERLTGSDAEFVLTPYADPTKPVARSVCGGWQIVMNTRSANAAGGIDNADYISGQHAKHPAAPIITGKAFGITESIGRAAQDRERPMLEARRARYAWLTPTNPQDAR
jgi:hypothetical protein